MGQIRKRFVFNYFPNKDQVKLRCFVQCSFLFPHPTSSLVRVGCKKKKIMSRAKLEHIGFGSWLIILFNQNCYACWCKTHTGAKINLDFSPLADIFREIIDQLTFSSGSIIWDKFWPNAYSLHEYFWKEANPLPQEM